jgi:hypothetical protein
VGTRVKVAGSTMLTSYFELVPRSRIGGAIHPFPYMLSWHSTYIVKHRDFYLFNLLQKLEAASNVFFLSGQHKKGESLPCQWFIT